MRMVGGDWAARAATFSWKKVLIKWPRPPTWGLVWVVICGASLTGNLVLLWPRLTLLASSASQFLLTTLNIIASRLPLLLSFISRPYIFQLSFLLARSHLCVLLNLILVCLVYRSGILSHPLWPPPPDAARFPPKPNKRPQIMHAISTLSRHDRHASQFQDDHHSYASSHNHRKLPADVPANPHPHLTPACCVSLGASISSARAAYDDDHAVDAIAGTVVDLAAKSDQILQKLAVPEAALITSQKEGTSILTTTNDGDDHRHHRHHQFPGMKHITKQQQQQQQFGSVHEAAAVAATAASAPQINIAVKKKQKSKKPSLFSIEPLNQYPMPDAVHPYPRDDKMKRSYTINSACSSSAAPSPSPSSSDRSSFQRSASGARRFELAAEDTHSDIHESKPTASLINPDGHYFDLSKEEFNEKVQTFISKFRRQLSMQRQDSFNRLLGLVKGSR